ncbi:MAG: hypothetical protein M0C28_33755 [Candidatus Moduliflexus flocculans]|nr:hypothetical protein [Candidatus Moduliflexus flocculans]
MLDQVWYPVNARIQTYWTLLFLGSDQLVGIAQWLAALVSAMGVFGMAHFFGYNPRRSAFASIDIPEFPVDCPAVHHHSNRPGDNGVLHPGSFTSCF